MHYNMYMLVCVTHTSFSLNGMGLYCRIRYFGDMDIPRGKSIEDAQKPETENHFPRNVRLLKTRYKPGMNFGDFSAATFAAFY